MESLYELGELRERFGLEVYADTSCLSGKNTQRRVCRRQHHAEMLGIQVGQVLALPPENPYPLLVALKPERGGSAGSLQWTYRFETAFWQADIFIDADPFGLTAVPEAEPIYDYFDALSDIQERMVASLEATPPWPQEHETLNKTLDEVIESRLQNHHRMQSERDQLHQRYG